jgi:hypothetical protein
MTVPNYSHIVVVVMENHDYSQIIGDTVDAPYINLLAAGGALLSDYTAITHPSEPNYFALYAGSTFGVTDDNFHAEPDPTLATILQGAGKSFVGYVESSGSDMNHNPWEYFPEGTSVEQDFSNFPTSNFNALPTVSFVIPGVNDDMHNGTIAQGDAWLQQNLDAYAQWAKANNSLLVVTWDENSGTSGNQVPTILYGADVVPGVYSTPYNHYNLLGTILAAYGLTGPNNAASAVAIGGGVFSAPACFAAGTRIRTDHGDVAVEQLQAGDKVVTLSDSELSAQPVKWVGHRRIGLAGHPRPETAAPVRIQRGAFTDDMPHTDLLISPDHAIFVDGVLICARQLVNGSTIRQELDWTAVDYYHVELDQHAILLAEGLPAESYIDTGNSGFFANSGAPLVLHPDLTDETDYPTREAGSCVPFVWDEASVQPVWQRLADRAAAIGQALPERVTTTDADLRLLADQRTIKPVISDSDRVVFVLPRGAREVRLLSRAQSPTKARPWLEDRRRLGVRVKRIVLRSADELREVPVDHPDLTRGWWAVERDGQIMSRWTDGQAVLPLPPMHGIVMLEIHLAGWMIYAVDAVPEVGRTEAA